MQHHVNQNFSIRRNFSGLMNASHLLIKNLSGVEQTMAQLMRKRNSSCENLWKLGLRVLNGSKFVVAHIMCEIKSSNCGYMRFVRVLTVREASKSSYTNQGGGKSA